MCALVELRVALTTLERMVLLAHSEKPLNLMLSKPSRRAVLYWIWVTRGGALLYSWEEESFWIYL